MSDAIPTHKDFFISRAGKDADFAVWLGRLIAAQGKSYVLQDEHFGHQNFIGAMDEALRSGARVVGLLSQAYVESDYCLAEAAAALTGDPFNKQQRLVLLRLEPCAPGGLLANIAYTNLLDERREADGRPLALKALRALGFGEPNLEGLPLPPEGTLSRSLQVLHPEVQAVPGFTAREGELATLEAALWRGDGTHAGIGAPGQAAPVAAVVAAKGMGGVGKSVLAREYAWRNRERYHGVWWVRAERRETLADDLIELGARFIPGLKEMPERDQAARRALDWIEQAGAEKPWLLVYDNIEEPSRIDGLTPRAGAHVLLTTRWSDWGRAAQTVPIGVFPPDVAARFLLESTGRADQAGAEKLAAALGYLPLALDHAAAYIRRTGVDFAAYETLAAELLDKAPKGVDYGTPVFATFGLAIDKAAEDCPDAMKLLGLSAFFAPDRIPLSLFTDDVLSAGARVEAVAALQQVSLVVPEALDDASPAITVHRLVQAAMRARLSEMGEHDNAAALATELVADAFPGSDPGPDDVRAWPACARLAPHALALFEFAPDSGTGAGKTSYLLNQTALNFVSRAAYAEAEPLLRRALAIAEASLGPDHPGVATTLNNLAGLLQATGRLGEAEPIYRRALAITEASLGPDHPDVAIRLNNLAGLLQDTGRLAEAEPLYRRALAIGEASLGPDHPDVGISLNNLAGLLRATGRLAEAEPLCRRDLAITEANLGPNHPSVAISLNNLAELLRETGRLAEAEPLCRRALAIGEASLGPDHPDIGTTLNNLAILLRASGRLAEAEPLYRRALAITEARLGPDHPSVAIRLSNLALLLDATGRSAEAEPLHRRALAIDEARLGPDHPDLATTLNNLAGLLQDTGRLAEAEPLRRRVVAILEKFERDTGHTHPNYEAAVRNLAALEADLREAALDASPNNGAAEPGPASLTPPSAMPEDLTTPPKTGKRGFFGGLFPRL